MPMPSRELHQILFDVGEGGRDVKDSLVTEPLTMLMCRNVH